MDGASVCIMAMKMINERFPHIFPQRCATHGYSLLLKDLSRLVFFAETLKGTVTITAWIVNHDWVCLPFASLLHVGLVIGHFLCVIVLLQVFTIFLASSACLPCHGPHPVCDCVVAGLQYLPRDDAQLRTPTTCGDTVCRGDLGCHVCAEG
jgi:hypothetical protein